MADASQYPDSGPEIKCSASAEGVPAIPFGEMVAAKQRGITADMVRDVIFYCPTTGGLRWRKNGKYAGGVKEGYIIIRLFGRNFPGHRLAWLLHTGRWPVGVIDHINHDRADNRACNLRDVSPTENARNRVFRRRRA